MTLYELQKEFWDSETERKAVIVFTKESFKKDYTETERSYEVSSDCKYFKSGKISNSLYGNCLDGKDNGVRLDLYIGNGEWHVEKIYLRA